MEQLKTMKEQLTAQVQAQLGNIHQVDTHELGEAIDMIKDLAEAEYYCSVVKAMEESEKKPEEAVSRYYYTERYMPIPYQRAYDSDRGMGRMYYGNQENPRDTGGNDSTRYGGMRYAGAEGSRYGGMRYADSEGSRYYDSWPMETVRDPREGRSAGRRKMYMESKEKHMPKEKQMQELESYMSELSSDMTEMIHDATPEERQMLSQKLSTLVAKIDQVK